MKYFIVLFALFVLNGCSSKKFYILSEVGKTQLKGYDLANKTVGVESISVPDYLKESKVAKKVKKNQIVYFKNALWAVDVDKDLTDTLIFDLQKSFSKSTITHYPWNGNVDIVVAIKIKRFIAYKNFIFLDALIKINKTDRIISLKIPIDSNSEEEIVEGMKKAFLDLEREVIKMLDDI